MVLSLIFRILCYNKIMDKKKLTSIIIMVTGLITLVVGVIFLVLNLIRRPTMADSDYLVSKSAWVLESGDCERSDDSSKCAEENVIWKFTENGKGTLTTNNHVNDYNFEWAIRDNQLIIQTDWLYELDNEYRYRIDQGAQTLTLMDGENEYKFVAQSE